MQFDLHKRGWALFWILGHYPTATAIGENGSKLDGRIVKESSN